MSDVNLSLMVRRTPLYWPLVVLGNVAVALGANTQRVARLLTPYVFKIEIK